MPRRGRTTPGAVNWATMVRLSVSTFMRRSVVTAMAVNPVAACCWLARNASFSLRVLVGSRCHAAVSACRSSITCGASACACEW